MNRFTYYNENTQAVIATGRPWPTKDESIQPPDLEYGVVLLLEVRATQPAYDQWTQKLEKDAIVYDVQAGTATTSWSVVALTQAEIDERTPAHVEIRGIKWKTDEASQAAFASMTLLIDKAAMPASDMVMIKDAMGVSQAMTVTQYQADVLTYGLACYTQFHS